MGDTRPRHTLSPHPAASSMFMSFRCLTKLQLKYSTKYPKHKPNLKPKLRIAGEFGRGETRRSAANSHALKVAASNQLNRKTFK